MPSRKLLILGLTTTAMLALVASPVFACMQPRCSFGCLTSGLAEGGETFVTFTSADRALIQIGIYTTPAMFIDYECATAFPLVDGIERIDGVQLVNLSTGLTLPNYHWTSSDASVEEFTSLARSDAEMSHPRRMRWQGFFTEVKGGSVGGIVHAFVFEVKLRPGTTPQQLVSALRRQGVLANGSANADGTLNFDHYWLRRVADGQVRVVFAGREAQAPERRTRIGRQ